MSIKRIIVNNFKSFKDLDIELGNFNILIGANASGKTNFIKIFEFLRDIVNSGLENAISMQSGVEYIKNLNIGEYEKLSLCMESDKKYSYHYRRKPYPLDIKIYRTIYEFSLELGDFGFKIVKDKLIQECDFVKLEKTKGGLKEKERIEKEKIILSCTDGKLKFDLGKAGKIRLIFDFIFPQFVLEHGLPPKTLLLQTPYFFLSPFVDIIRGISLYDFDPKLPKKATPVTGKAELEEDGSNLSIVLKNIITDKEKKRKFLNLVHESLPFVSDLGVEKFTDKSLLLKFREIYTKNQDIPASIISDGTIKITALIIALYFEEKPITIIEEPERNIHPFLISKVMAMMKDASQNKQIIVTTHNPEMIKHANLEDILLVSRDKEGFSTISRPCDKEEVKIFLENDMGIEDLYVQNLLEI